jgi:hypothetical protein
MKERKKERKKERRGRKKEEEESVGRSAWAPHTLRAKTSTRDM